VIQAVPKTGVTLKADFVVDLPTGNENRLFGVFNRTGDVFEVIATGSEKFDQVARALW